MNQKTYEQVVLFSERRWLNTRNRSNFTLPAAARTETVSSVRPEPSSLRAQKSQVLMTTSRQTQFALKALFSTPKARKMDVDDSQNALEEVRATWRLARS
ncbi:hypothetical protein HNQ77_003352 [Silvibacterium bohemicum]|uniref:Uncharacterized protein n=1 Tax=Silvibacterium bohemicum TaxID=1577686 RepID=A0A841K540_9BACT|nr:hypothetical protein [Silvibacterium bohemicum]MBB6145394.1 hypothetical protein [Silvibacterium bohemicum]